MTRLTAAILLGPTALHCEHLFDSRSGKLLDARVREHGFVMKHGVACRWPAP